MTPFMSLLLPIILSAIAVVVIPLIIHMTPLHKRDYIKLPEEEGAMNALRPFNIPPNDYMVPHPGSGRDTMGPEYLARRDAGPVMIVTVVPTGPWNMGRILAMWFLFACVVSASVAFVVGTIVPPGGNRHAVFHYIAVITFLTYAMGAVPLSIWYRRKWSTTFKYALDSLLYAVATGWIFWMMWPKQ